MSVLTPAKLAAACGGRWLRPPACEDPVEGVGIDTRLDLRGRAFFAIRGQRYDGHDYVSRAAACGAKLAVVDRPPAMGGVVGGCGVLLVPDTRLALGAVAAAHRRALPATRVIAVTGSCGKTTVKALLDAVLSTSLRGRAAPKSFNNDIGVPLAILAADPGDDYLVLEIGANRPGEIEALARIARPDLGVITMIGQAHLEGLGSLDTIAREKASLLRHAAGGVHVVNADAPALRRHLPPHVPGGAGLVLFGESPDAHLRLTGCGAAGGSWWFEANGTRLPLGLPGRHNAINALAAVAVGRHLGIDDQRIAAALSAARPVDMRLSRHEVGAVTVYNDAYNANPDSMEASLETFLDLAAGAPRRVAVLGDMLELGEAAAEQHRRLGCRLMELDRRVPLDRLFLVGDLAAHVAEPIAGRWGPQRLTLMRRLDGPAAAAVSAELAPGDSVLLKGSRAMGLERVLDAMAPAEMGGVRA